MTETVPMRLESGGPASSPAPVADSPAEAIAAAFHKLLGRDATPVGDADSAPSELTPVRLGAALDLLRYAGATLERAARGVSEDRLVLWQSDEIVAGMGDLSSVALASTTPLVTGLLHAQSDEKNAPLVAYVGTFSSPLPDVLPTQVDLPPGNGRGIPKIPAYYSERSITYYPRFTQSSEKSALARDAGPGGIIARGFRLAFDGSLSALPT